MKEGVIAPGVRAWKPGLRNWEKFWQIAEDFLQSLSAEEFPYV